MLSKRMYYILSLTWGLPMTLIGLLISAIFMIYGQRPKRYGWCYYFEIGRNWGGVELGLFFLCSKNSTDHVKMHEFGHSIQNCYFGFLMPIIVSIPSAIRYWYRAWAVLHDISLPPYDSIWFEGDATKLGNKYIEHINNDNSTSK